MLTKIHPKLPMRDKIATRDFYLNVLGFTEMGSGDFPLYLMVEKDEIEIHFFLFRDLDPKQNYGQIYIRTNHIEKLYFELSQKELYMPKEFQLQSKPWGQIEFSVTDPDHNLITFGQRKVMSDE